MIFTSYTYICFLFLAFALHWAMPSKLRKHLLLFASYVFYCSWDYRYGALLLGVSLFNWAYGRFVVARDEEGRTLALGVIVNLLPLLYFKYTGFFLSSFTGLARALGADVATISIHIVLPLGISFFTFQGIAYLVDVASGEEPFEKPLDFLLYKAFWPQLIAGPIIRPGEISGTIASDRTITYEDLSEGGKRILFGLGKKVVLADSIAPNVDLVFAAGTKANFLDVLVGMVGFGAQIYLDFSGYSDIAIGSARLFGFRFPENFETPYASLSPQEFWNRWHISLSRWIRDYVFTPLNFAARRRKAGSLVPKLYLVVAMACCGFWHGAAFTFVLWGVWHGLLLVANQTILRGVFPEANARKDGLSKTRRGFAWALSTSLVMLGWVLFRAQSIEQAFSMYAGLFTLRGGVRPALVRENGVLLVFCVASLVLVYPHLASAYQTLKERLHSEALVSRALRGLAYSTLLLLIIALGGDAKAFVYFQF